MKDVRASGIESRHNQVVRQTIRVDRSMSATSFVPLIQMPQLYIQDRRLNRIKSRVSAFFNMHIFLLLPVVSQTTHFLRELIVIRNYRTSVAVSTEVFPRIKTETTRETKRAT